jgi:acyl carrier protein
MRSVPSPEDVFQSLREVLSSHFGLRPEQVIQEARLAEDLDLDSIDWIDMAVKLQAETGLKLTEAELAAIRTVQDVVDVIHRRLSASASADG